MSKNEYHVFAGPWGRKSIEFDLVLPNYYGLRDGRKGIRFDERDIDAIRQFRDDLSEVIDMWDERERKASERRAVLRALRTAQQDAAS